MSTFHCMHCKSIKPIIEEKEVKINRALSVYLCNECADAFDNSKADQLKVFLKGPASDDISPGISLSTILAQESRI